MCLEESKCNVVSFGSNYKFNIGKNFPYEVQEKLGLYEIKGSGVKVYEEFTPFQEAVKTGVFASMIVSAPDKYDGEIETLLLSRGIDFHKQTFKEALSLDNIKNRIQVSEDDKYWGYQLVEIDTDILNQLFIEDGNSYIEPSGTNGIGDRYIGVEKYLKTGQKIDATRVHFSEEDGKLTAKIGDGRHRFAYMRDLGMKSIPVAIDKKSYEIAVKHGLVK